MPLICYNTPMHLHLAQGSAQSYAFIRYDRANALEIKLCKIH
ncbi:hypothetical protein HPHPP15B_1531 [Helicobacter pylori Hp P-15b]|uniref:Uncharacterized protein n=1 Tax=Helicobacter pylori Hp P-15 TaxID=992080 RepID=J0F792_HELPX|nr:hypothetical protein HPHPP15_1267 [Helicobacter pylori Hp P-15]EJC31079.1 hypothetical protein HPHPP15B_1531 [Helicobacter pylori Hp P-15b]